MKLPHECKNIDEIRREIDDLDIEIINLISRRRDFIQAIVQYKRNTDDVYALDRYKAVIDERRRMAEQRNLPPDVIEKIYRLMMDYFIEEQLDLLNSRK
jgi:isochorismate pyruvate lyase